MVELVDEAQRAVAHAAALGLRKLYERRALHPHFAGSRRVEAAEQMQERALAGTGRADDGDALALDHCQVDAEQHRDLERPAAIGLLQSPAFQHGLVRGERRLIHSAAPPQD